MAILLIQKKKVKDITVGSFSNVKNCKDYEPK